MPSRGRFELARKSVESLGPGSYEVLIGVDPDDPELASYKTLKSKHIKVVEFDKRYGYQQLHIYYNHLASMAKGDWIMLWNDDAVMEKPDWIEAITNYNHQKPIVLSPYDPVDNLFPVLSRKWYQLIGHYSLSTHVDSWVQNIGSYCNNQIPILGVSIKHEGEKLNDQTHKEVRDVVRQTSEYHRSPEAVALREQEAKLLANYMIEQGYRYENNN